MINKIDPLLASNAVLSGLKEQFLTFDKRASEIHMNILTFQAKAISSFQSHKYEELLPPAFDRIDCLMKEFNAAVNELQELLEQRGVSTQFRLFRYTEPTTVEKLDIISAQSRKAVKIIESLVSVVPTEIITKLGDIRKIVQTEINHVNCQENLLKTIEEIENAHSLASCLITARVVMHVYEQIPKKDPSEKEDIMGTKLAYLIDNKIIDAKRTDVQSSLIKASKKSRDFLSHRIDTNPDVAEALSLLGDCITLIKITEKAGILKQ